MVKRYRISYFEELYEEPNTDDKVMVLASDYDALALQLVNRTAELVAAQGRLAEAVEALQQISKGEGRFSMDHHEHACNTIEDMKALAVAAIDTARAGEEKP